MYSPISTSRSLGRIKSSMTAKPTLNGILLGAVTCLLWLVADSAAEAQSFGQWWWVGRIGVSGFARQNQQEGRETSTYNRTGLQLGGTLNGFVLHPRVASFRLSADGLFSAFSSGRYDSENQYGGDVEFKLFPFSNYTGEIVASHRQFGFSPSDQNLDPLEIDVPNSSTSLGIAWLLGKSPIGSFRIGGRQGTTSFVNPSAREGQNSSGFVGWNYSKRTFSHSFSVRSFANRSGTTDFEREGLNALLRDNGQFGGGWLWRLTATAIDVKNDYSDRTLQQGQARGVGSLTRKFENNSVLRFSSSGGSSSTEFSDNPAGSSDKLDWTGQASYLMRIKPNLDLGPFLGYFALWGDDFTTTRPDLGLTTNWRKTWSSWSSVLSGSFSYGTTRFRSDVISGNDEGSLRFFVSETISHKPKKVTRQLLIQAGHNESTLTADDGEELPGFEFGRVVGLSDSIFTQAAVISPLGKGTFTARGEVGWVQSRGELFGETASSTIFRANILHESRAWYFRLFSGYREFDSEVRDTRGSGFISAQGNWRPWQFLTLNASFNLTRQFPELGPDIDSAQTYLSLSFRMGQLSFEISGTETWQELLLNSLDGPTDRRNRWISISISRSLGSWLPIISAPQRKGIVR